jgi:nucleoside-diphosphate-sugar epimerase
MKKIAITGANGFIGSFLTNFLKNSYQVTGLVRKGSDTSLLEDETNITFVDYNSNEDLERIFSAHDILIHSAALTKAAKWHMFEKININLSLKLAKMSNKFKLEQFIFLSSQAAAGACPTPKTETDDCQPVSMYGKSKLMAEIELQKVLKIPYTFIRSASVFGPGEKDFYIYFKMINKHISTLIGKKERYLSLIYVEDLARLTAATVANPKAYHEIFFASDGKTYTWEYFAQTLSKIMNKSVYQIRIPENLVFLVAEINEFIAKFTKKYPTLNREKIKEMKELCWLVDNNKARDILNYEPKYDLKSSLTKTYKWYLEKGWLE